MIGCEWACLVVSRRFLTASRWDSYLMSRCGSCDV